MHSALMHHHYYGPDEEKRRKERPFEAALKLSELFQKPASYKKAMSISLQRGLAPTLEKLGLSLPDIKFGWLDITAKFDRQLTEDERTAILETMQADAQGFLNTTGWPSISAAPDRMNF